VVRVTRSAVFLDRDGTLNVRPAAHQYITKPGDFKWLPGAAEGAAHLARAGYVLCVTSNQRGVSEGLVDLSTLRACEAVIQQTLAQRNCAIAAFRYCVHSAAANCDCRKPRPGMILRLAEELNLDLERSWMIGDSETDALAGQAAGCRAALIGPAPRGCLPDVVAESLDAVSRLVVADAGGFSDALRPSQPRTPRRGPGRSSSVHRSA
jgi:D-glycero-D-manno-heptose 1,7-bisphosphate phosphatase